MARRRTLTLTDDQRQALEDQRDHARRPDLRERCAALLKIAGGMTPAAVSRQGLLKSRDPDTVYAWLKHYQAEGLPGLVQHQHGGPRRRGL